MQVVVCPLASAALWSRRPTVGALMVLCEESYLLLGRLVPGLSTRSGRLVSQVKGAVDLHLTIEAQSPYTTQVRLTHVFGGAESGHPAFGPEPDACLRVYHDARQVEVLNLRQTALPLQSDYCAPALDAKWRANLFLAKWLAYCLQQGHRFGAPCIDTSLAEDDGLVTTCGLPRPV